MIAGPVAIDLRAAQSPHYRERGIARFAVDFTLALLAAHPDLVGPIIIDEDLLPFDGLDALADARRLTAEPHLDGGILHVLSPAELDIPLRRLWPRRVSRAGTRLIVTVHDLIPAIFPEIYLSDPGLRARYMARLHFVRAADHVVAVSQSTAQDLVQRLALPPERITVIGEAAGERFTRPRRRGQALRQARSSVPGLGERFVVYNGAVEPRKNVERLMEAFARLPTEVRTGRQLVLVCRLSPAEQNHLEVRARALGIETELVLTGFVPDDTLVALNQSAELVAFPSLYEGFGLPVAEAMACGAPVIASRTSSLVELVRADATFDPLDVADMAEALERALVDEDHRARLLEWSARPVPSWRDVADRAAELYRRILQRPGSSGRWRPSGLDAVKAPSLPRGPTAWRRRPVIALVTPWPPARSGIATYSARLVRELGRWAEVDLFVDGVDRVGGADDAHAVSEAPAYLPRNLPRVDAARGGYDAVIACLGNSEFHTGALSLVRGGLIRPVVLAHEVRFTGLYRHAEARGVVPEGSAGVLERWYPAAPEGLAEGGWVTAERAVAKGALMAREVIAHSRRFLTTSTFAAELALLEALPSDRERIGVWTFAYPPASPRDPAAEEDGLVCAFGIVDPSKSPETLIEAVALLSDSRPDLRVAFVGPVDPGLKSALLGRAAELGIDQRVTVTGEVDDAQYHSWLGRATLAVQLRRHSNGECSATVADCLSRGVPTVVAATGPAADLPGCVAKVPARATPSELASVVAELLSDKTARRAMGEQSLRFAAERGFDRAAKWCMEQVVDQPAPIPST